MAKLLGAPERAWSHRATKGAGIYPGDTLVQSAATRADVSSNQGDLFMDLQLSQEWKYHRYYHVGLETTPQKEERNEKTL